MANTLKTKDEYKELLQNCYKLFGAAAGDIIGSVYEFNNIKTEKFELFSPKCDFTDDTVLTVAVAHSLLTDRNYSLKIKEYGRKYTGRGYGGNFYLWLNSDNTQAYNSYGNGSAMRVCATAYAHSDIKDVLSEAKASAEITHNHPEGIKGAQATAAAIFMAHNGSSKVEIKNYISHEFNYNLSKTLDEIRPEYYFNETCQDTVPQAISAFLESADFEDSIRKAISLGGDSDTLACITGSIAAAFYKKIPEHIFNKLIEILPSEFLEIIYQFELKFSN